MPVEPALAERLRHLGPVDVATLFELAVADADTGYYARPADAVFGETGDFVTAPEISQTFGELLGLALVDAWQRQGRPAGATLAELGPGRGVLMADLWRAVRKVPGVSAAWRMHLVERSPALRKVQRRALGEPAPVWHGAVESLPDASPLYLVANEFLDALPLHQLVRAEHGWRERCVVVGPAGEAGWELRPAPPALAEDAERRFPEAAAGAVAEPAPLRAAVAAVVARRIAAAGGLALLVDYGGIAVAPRDTLQAVVRHRSVPPLSHLGRADLSSAVDFGPLVDAARDAGAAVFGPSPQARVLRALGIELRALRLAEALRGAARQDLLSGVRRLLDPRAMGEMFKVLAIAPADSPPPAGFGEEDRR